MKRNKSGISLIVLVITIIVMIILAAAVVITLNNTNIINRANEAVDASDLKQVQNIAALAWSEAYLDKNAGETVNFQERVETALRNNGVSLDKYAVTATETGVEVCEKTLGALIKGPEDYYKSVDYTVTVGSGTYDEWYVYYEDEANGYVFLMSYYPLGNTTNIELTSLTQEQERIYNIFKLNQPGYTLNFEKVGSRAAAALVTSFDAFANKEIYGEAYVIGAIGAPTLELYAASYNASHPDATKLVPIVDPELGYYINYWGKTDLKLDYPFGGTALASPHVHDSCLWVADYAYNQEGSIIGELKSEKYSLATLHPVVCLKSSIPAEEGTTTDFSLIK